MTLKQEILQNLFVNGKIPSKRVSHAWLARNNLLEKILDFGTLDSEVMSMTDILWCIVQDITETPTCKICGKFAGRMDSIGDGSGLFKEICSKKCRTAYDIEKINADHFLDSLYSPVPTGLKKYCDENDITSLDQIPECSDKNCSNKVTYNSANSRHGFALFCSPECSRGSSKISLDSLTKLEDRDWLYEQRITLRKSKERIAEELSISIIPINTWIKKHNIPKVRYNESEYRTMLVLEDSTKLKNLYDEGKTCEEIAKEIGSSKATVSLFLRKHGIEARPPNSYEKKFVKRSKAEIWIADYVKSLGFETILNKKSLITSHDLDIYIPEKNLAIEYNGVYYHTEKFKGKSLHSQKTNLCKDKGVKLLHIWEDSWVRDPDLIISMINHRLGLSSENVPARKCVIKEIDISTAKDFLIENHVQGYSNSSVKLGLFFDDKLVAAMTFGTPRFNQKYKWELIRFAVLKNHSVIGGFSKLMKYFTKTYNGSIVTYADLSYSDGGVYENNGFKFLNTSKPSYWYLANGVRVSRTKFMKKNLTSLGDKVQHMSENEITEILGIPKIWNCGTSTYVLERD